MVVFHGGFSILVGFGIGYTSGFIKHISQRTDQKMARVYPKAYKKLWKNHGKMLVFIVVLVGFDGIYRHKTQFDQMRVMRVMRGTKMRIS